MDGRWVLLVAAACGLVGCGPSVQDIYMSKDGGGSLKATRFTPDNELHLFAIAVSGYRGSKMHVRIDGMRGEFDHYPWPNRDSLGKINIDIQFFLLPDAETGEMVPGATDGSMIGAGGAGNEPEEPGDPRIFSGAWPLGHYKTHVTLDGEKVAELPFDVVPLR